MQARIPLWAEYEPAHGTFILTEGFRVNGIDGCTVSLRNDNARIVAESMKIDDPNKALVVLLSLQLNRLGPTKGRSTYRYSNESGLPGAWRTEFKYKGLFSRNIVG